MGTYINDEMLPYIWNKNKTYIDDNCEVYDEKTIQLNDANEDEYGFIYELTTYRSSAKITGCNSTTYCTSCDVMELPTYVIKNNVKYTVTSSANFTSTTMVLKKTVSLRTLILPRYLTEIGGSFSMNNPFLERIVFPYYLLTIGIQAFRGCTNLKYLEFPKHCSSTTFNYGCFYGCESIETLILPNIYSIMITSAYNAFDKLTNLKYIYVPKNFSTDLYIPNSPLVTYSCLMGIINNLTDRTGLTPKYTFKIGSVNLAKLSAADKLIATNKNWAITS